MQAVHGDPQAVAGRPARLCVCGLGKFGGCELGYASDIELMFVYDGDGRTSRPEAISNLEYFQRLVELFRARDSCETQGDFRSRSAA